MAEEPTYTPQEVAQAFGKHPATIRHWIKTGELEARKAGKGWLVPHSAVRKKLIQEGLTAPANTSSADSPQDLGDLNIADGLSPIR